MFRTMIAATILAAIAALVMSAGADAKGPFSMEIRGGDLTKAITIQGPIDEQGMFGPQIATPTSFPDTIYTVEFFTVSEHRSTGTISYYPAHDGVPAAWRTSYGFFSVPDPFNATFTKYFPARDDGETSIRWYLLPGVGLGLLAIGGLGRGGQRLLSRRKNDAV